MGMTHDEYVVMGSAQKLLHNYIQAKVGGWKHLAFFELLEEFKRCILLPHHDFIVFGSDLVNSAT